MNRKTRAFIIFMMVYILSYYLLIGLFQGNRELMVYIGSAFQVIAPLFSGVMLLRQFYVQREEKLKYYWLLTSVATFSYAAGTVIFRYNLAVHHIGTISVYSDALWYLSIFSFIFALIFVFSLKKDTSKTIQYVFDIVIVMVVATSISLHFVIEPIFSSMLNVGLFQTILYVCYPVGILVLLFAVLSLYYSNVPVFPRKVLFTNLTGFTILLIAIMNNLYLTINDKYMTDNVSDPLWALSILLFGLGSLYDHQNVKRDSNVGEVSLKYSGGILNRLTLRLILPYLSVMIIFTFMIFQGVLEFNSIVIGSIISTLLIIIRQVFTVIQNSELLIETQELNKKLERKVAERTRELYLKNQELEDSMEKVEYIAYHDSLTSLTNRRYFEEAVERAIGESSPGERMAVLFIDLDRFKFINDTLGHHIGDLLLIAVADILKKIVGEDNIVSRQGGDEFMILLMNTSKEEAGCIADLIVKELENPIGINGNELFITSSIGITLYPDHGNDVDTLIKRADIAMYSAKELGENGYQFFNASMDEHITLRVNLENGLRRAIELNELSAVYQPKLDLRANQIIGVEALLRWNHSKYGFISPATFIPLAEETGLIVKLGDWILYEACVQLKKWHDAGLDDLSVSVNVSTIQFLQKDFVGKVERIVEEANVDPTYIELEITESTMKDLHLVVVKLEQLRQLGFKISVDDFGSGYSSLSHIKNLPIDILKIDKTFIDDIENDESNAAIVSTILTLASNLNLTVIAEGVENEKQYKLLKESGCDQIQGYFLSKPLPASEITGIVSTTFLINP
ncbi:DUF4084 domain-containing protein [Bacillus sp. KH172YL63]|uniref:DUF4084 domain-containing protein n=1 Tax=Bacillus sp. KH172YL63 TaxID=2709784 RepID=UPI0013E4D835|nr:DUF4084 domain-containing protein [Bacillus sp. KH172YL63]BCB02148.1 hypothetical protein KH172YL63_02810 [Bacillus sp. KH172YL63]